MAAYGNVFGRAELDHAVEQPLVLIELALSRRQIPVLPTKAGFKRRLVEVLDKDFAVHPAVFAFELESDRVEDIAEVQKLYQPFKRV